MTSSIAISLIDTDDRLRTLDPAWVALLAEEIEQDGLVEPIRVVERGERYRLVSGARRIAAHIQLDLADIEADIDPEGELPDDASVRLAEIKGHMLRGELTALDRSVTVSAWCDLYKQANGLQKPGPKRKLAAIDGTSDEALDESSATIAPNWSEAAQTALGLGRRTIFNALKIASRIGPDIRSRICLHPIADVQRELLALADMTPVRQKAVVDLLTADPAEAGSVAEAIAKLDAVPQPIKLDRVGKLVERFSGLDEKEQFKFFDKNEGLIEAWYARRTAKKVA